MPLMAATMLVPSMTLASSIRPGSRVTHQSLNSGSSSRSKTLCLNEKEKFAERCEVTIDETGVKGPAGHITNVVQWIKEEKEFSYGGAVAGGVAGAVIKHNGPANKQVPRPAANPTPPPATPPAIAPAVLKPFPEEDH